MMESSNLYELQQQLASFSSLATAQSTTELPHTHQWNPSLPLNNDAYDHYMNQILPMSAAQLTANNYFGHERCPNPVDLCHSSSSPLFSSQLGWNVSPSPPSANVDYVLDSVITSSSTSSFKDKGISRTKRVSSLSQKDAAPKKKAASCTLPKKIGDRIAALHRLVAPFGKTDAASVLTEALGYIQFLHHQIQTLSMSCIKQSQSNHLQCFQRVSKGKECWDAKQVDLQSRGLSLVPISVAAYVSSSSSVGLD
ncbi:transcription factor bHLH123-like isoform X2 [Salvia splendens]|uniref:transcription factor bHLH123-like isoform X2 n=1 Tax=Salvia splendens TaxID=180675 RepID=UPI001C275581|nr:transcription factor bHLH123-like isoform X2 [Salvia splendens]